MRLVIFASAFLIATAAAAQNLPSHAPGAAPSVVPPVILSQGTSDTCLAIRTIRVPRTERVPLIAPNPAPDPQARGPFYVLPRSISRTGGEATCTPANRFRAMYIPNPTVRRDAVPALCPDCVVLPKDQPSPQLQPVRQPR